MPIKDELFIMINSLEMMHLGHAVDMMRKSKEISKTAKTVFEREAVRRYAVSSIIHGFCALESMVNRFAYEMFSLPEAERFIPEEKRSFLQKQFLNKLDMARILDKLKFILDCSGNSELPARLDAELRELNNLRNWIVHGVVYTTIILMDPSEDDPRQFTALDTEVSVNWKNKFPNTKFKSLEKLDYEDAQVALTIILKALRILYKALSEPVCVLFTCEFPPRYTVLWGDESDNDESDNIAEALKL